MNSVKFKFWIYQFPLYFVLVCHFYDLYYGVTNILLEGKFLTFDQISKNNMLRELVRSSIIFGRQFRLTEASFDKNNLKGEKVNYLVCRTGKIFQVKFLKNAKVSEI